MSDQAKKFLPSDSPAFENFNEMVKAESGEMVKIQYDLEIEKRREEC